MIKKNDECNDNQNDKKNEKINILTWPSLWLQVFHNLGGNAVAPLFRPTSRIEVSEEEKC